MKKTAKRPLIAQKKDRPEKTRLPLSVQREVEMLIEHSSLSLIRLESLAAERDSSQTAMSHGEVSVKIAGGSNASQGVVNLTYMFSFETCAETKRKTDVKPGDVGTKVSIAARFNVVYRYDSDAKTLSDDKVEKFGRLVAAANVWPYWRELVQSTTSRMGLPPLLMPLLLPHQLMG